MLPYLIDNHTHGAFGINFNEANYDEIKFVLSELYKKSIKGICPTLVGDSDENLQRQFKLFKKIKKEQLNSINSEALILGVHLEGTFLSPNKLGIQNKDFIKKPTIENYAKLTKNYEDIIKIVTLAPELDEGLIEYLNNKNIKPQAGHSIAQNIKNCTALTHTFNAMPSIHHRNHTLTLEGLINNKIYCEIIADLIHNSADILKLFFKIKPKNKILLISDSLPSSNFNKDIIFCGKKINKEGKDKKGVLAGSNMTLDAICLKLIEKKILTQEDVFQMGFKNQIEYFNLSKEEINILNR